jgi:integrase
MASIKKFHLRGCKGGDCECLWALDYRPLGLYGPRRRVRFRTRRQAERFLTETAHQAARGEYVAPAKVPTFAEVAEDWFRSKSDRRPSHVSDLRTRLDKHLFPVFGPRRLDNIRVADFEKLRDDLRDQRFAPTTINQILRIAGAVFRLAIKHGRCATNPLDRVDRAHKPAREITACDDRDADAVSPDNLLDPDEVRRLLQAANPGFDRTLFLTAFVSGAREGELLALRWTDLELPSIGPGRMAIRRSLSWARLKGEEIRPRYYPPKTRAGRRMIEIPEQLVAAFRRWKLQCPQSADDLVFPTPEGQPLCRDRLLRTRFRPALARARLRRVTFHSLRHSCASAMIAEGAPITEVQYQLGHSNPSITLGIYSHWFKNAKGGGAAGRLAKMVVGAPAGEGKGEWAVRGHSDEPNSSSGAASA